MNASPTGSKPVRHPETPRGSASVDGGLSSRDETGALPVRGTECRAAHGGQPVSKSGEQRSIRWLGAEGMCRSLRACLASKLTRSVTEHLHHPALVRRLGSPLGMRCLRVRLPTGALRSRWRTSSPSAQKLNEAPARVGGISSAQGGRVSVAAKSNFAREVYSDARFASNEEDSDRTRARAPCGRSRLVRRLVANETQASSILVVRSHDEQHWLCGARCKRVTDRLDSDARLHRSRCGQRRVF